MRGAVSRKGRTGAPPRLATRKTSLGSACTAVALAGWDDKEVGVLTLCPVPSAQAGSKASTTGSASIHRSAFKAPIDAECGLEAA